MDSPDIERMKARAAIGRAADELVIAIGSLETVKGFFHPGYRPRCSALAQVHIDRASEALKAAWMKLIAFREGPC